MKELTSYRIETADAFEAMELFFRNGWTDGLPVVPPTPERVSEFLAYAGVDPDFELGAVQERGRVATAEKVACNAVMAGCQPEYMPVLLAAVQAITDPLYNFQTATTSTSGGAPLLIVNGPVSRAIGMNCRESLFGPGNRANATIGRAIRLVATNVLGAEVGTLDRACLGHPGKYSYCIAEDELHSPWEPLHVDLGYSKEDSIVTAVHLEGPHHVRNQLGATPESVLSTFADAMKPCTFVGGSWVVIMNPEHAQTIARGGWSKRDVRQYLYEQTRRTVAEMKRACRIPGEVLHGDDDRRMQIVDSPDSILVIAAGSPGEFSAIIPPWAGGTMSRLVSRPIHSGSAGNGACAVGGACNE